MTPLEINILLHCHTTPAPVLNEDAPAVQETIKMLLREELIMENSRDYYITTEKGVAHIKQLCNLPFPKEVWMGFDGQVICVE